MRNRTVFSALRKPFALVLLVALLLCACGQSKPATLLPPAPTENNYAALGDDVRMLTDSDGILMYSGYSSNDGLYRVMMQPDGSANIVYVDYATRKEMILCDRPECKHNDSSCNGWLSREEMQGGVGLFGDGEHLYLQRLGNDEAPPEIRQLDMNGSNRTTLLNFPDGANTGSAIVKDGDTFYFIIDYTEERDGEAVHVRYLASFRDNQIQPICEVNATSFILGVNPYGFVIKERVGDDETFTITETLRFYRMSTGEYETLLTWKHGYAGISSMDRVVDGYLYRLDLESRTLAQYDLADNSHKIITDQIPKEWTEINIPGRCFGNHIFLTVDGTDYAIDLATGEIAEPTLRAKTGNAFVCVSAENEDYFYVNYKEESYTYTDNDFGVPETRTSSRYLYALILKEDYWENKPNFIPIEPLPID